MRIVYDRFCCTTARPFEHDRGHVLVAAEYDGADPHVIDLAAGKVIFRAKGRIALWMPQ